tara:strand:+ start:4936 stop:5886 length:951 start_codon:yes stop_codon:yes gene_type:complete
MVKCAVCGKEFDSDRQLHAHIKAHDLRMVEYYQKYFPRYDLHTGDFIKFKNKKQYFSSDFNSRTNLRMWLKSQSQEEAKNYCMELLVNRKQEKELIYAPTQVELRSILSPPIQYYNEIFGDYYKLCSEIGFKNKYKNVREIISASQWDKPEYKIFIDTREQRPLRFSRGVEVRKLDYGDYAFNSKQATCNCYIERKGLSDFVGTLSGGYERFVKEIERAKENEANLIILVESKFTNALYFNEQRKSYNKEKVFKNVKATPEFVFHRVRSLSQKYPHIQFLFVNGRKEASRVIERIFTCECAYKNVDLQLAYDLKIL